MSKYHQMKPHQLLRFQGIPLRELQHSPANIAYSVNYVEEYLKIWQL